MTQTVPLYYLLFVAFGILVIWGVVRAAGLILASARRTTEAVEKNTAALAAMDAKLGEAGKLLGEVPKLLGAITKLCEAQFQIMQPQRDARQNPFGRPNGPLPPRDVDTANMEHEIAETMRAYGVTREEALLRMNGANDRSVWGADMFENWSR